MWWKALTFAELEPTENNLRRIVLCLGGFHTEMNFFERIGYLMDSSGLQEVLELIYAPNAVIHMLSGKAIARAVRVHFIVDAALNTLMLRKVFNVPLPCHTEASENNDSDTAESDSVETDDVDNSLYLDKARTFYEQLMSGNISAEEAYSSNILAKAVIRNFKGNSRVCEDILQNFSFVGPVHKHDQHFTQIHQSRMHRKLRVTFAVHPSHASIH